MKTKHTERQTNSARIHKATFRSFHYGNWNWNRSPLGKDKPMFRKICEKERTMDKVQIKNKAKAHPT
ncbi:hypothetical protein [Collibacillus ludicampi]|uniref:hypothetical protein n=1 Tax=Collibacillus ludicampi TaxID=2771369 RepID=UPI002493F73E|nr:hypothetical protein [Collibacillus ludicampi]